MSPSPRLRRTAGLLLGAAAALVLATACSDTDNGSTPYAPTPPATTPANPPATQNAGEDRIVAENFAFDPDTLTVNPGEKVTVVNKDSTAHTVTATESGAFDTGTIDGGKSGTFTAPSKPGSYDFVCSFHSNMTGKLIVR
ncbi:cupredoxin domain-containing protein [Streptomyces cavernicola]|uniref:Cupredoxin domain-containing protein n=1 Tax=Streptomyces cavernicola TaxID=3043613 RepID=A0ABT6SG70_9ACTN|nr:cupredoxin domain-containing protein [Streptomyces sp. B-S-A6]MDI3406849.1 cupredoxin domain-containing protein [Streptomyces sp. B-S-A6]